jgi:hypothetical protein
MTRRDEQNMRQRIKSTHIADYALAADSEFAGGQEHRTAIRVPPDYHWVGVMSAYSWKVRGSGSASRLLTVSARRITNRNLRRPGHPAYALRL